MIKFLIKILIDFYLKIFKYLGKIFENYLVHRSAQQKLDISVLPHVDLSS